MKHVSLIRTDEEAEAINISLGEAVIGRGPLLNCVDKRVSRNHGLIKLSEKGDVILTSKHLNPIFYSEKKQPLVEIHSGNSVTLHDGDEFALLSDCYRFRVAISSGNEVQNNGCINGETVIDKNRVKEQVEKNECIKIKQEIESQPEKLEKTECTRIKLEMESQSENAVTCSSQCAVDSNRNRNLPTWMTNTSNGASTPGSSATVKKERKRKETVKNDTSSKKARATPKKNKSDELSDEDEETVKNETASKRVRATPKKKKTDELSDEDEEAVKSETTSKKARVTPKKKKIDELSDEDENDELPSEISKGHQNKKTEEVCKKDDKSEMDVDKTGASSTSVNKKKQHELSEDDEEKESKKDVADGTKEQTTSSEEKKLDDDKEESDDQTPDSPVQNAAANNTRQKCLYGANCYRTNPQHRTDFSHPGDADFDDNIPECPYGLICYRKNKQHRLDYKHTTMPQQLNNPQNKKRKNAGTRKNYADDDDEEDDYDFDDPFLNDASSDDYQPTDSDSGNSPASSDGEEEQDTKRMLKEAKKFTRKKK